VISNVLCGKCLRLALSPCGVESSCDTLPRAGLVWRWPGPLFCCLWQVIILPEAVVCAVFHVCVGFVRCALIYFCENDHGCVSSCYRVAFLWFLWAKIREHRRRRVFSIFFCAFTRRVLCFNPREGSTNYYHLVAATILEDRLRAEERYPR